MKFDNHILNELQTLSPLLAGIQKENVFSVPVGYFETLSDTVLIGLKEEAGITDTTKIADVPQGYFENLSSAILDKIKAQQKNTVTDEPAELPVVLQSIQHTNLFEVPQGYSENLSSAIFYKIKAQQKDISINEEEELSILLRSMQHINVFEVPKEYFNTVPVNILNSIKATPAKVVGMHKLRSFIKYAAAAVIAGAMVLGVYKYTDKPDHTNVVSPVSFAKLDAAIEKGKNMNELQFTAALNNLTKEDITIYLEKNGNEEDMSLMTSSSDEIDLPNKDEYLQDEKTLENYLDKIKFQN